MYTIRSIVTEDLPMENPMSIYIFIQSSAEEAEPCMFCLETEDTVTANMPCECRIHVHTLCLNTWLSAENSCPLCRSELYVAEPESSPPPQNNSNLYMYACMILMTLLTATVIAVYFYITKPHGWKIEIHPTRHSIHKHPNPYSVKNGSVFDEVCCRLLCPAY